MTYLLNRRGLADGGRDGNGCGRHVAHVGCSFARRDVLHDGQEHLIGIDRSNRDGGKVGHVGWRHGLIAHLLFVRTAALNQQSHQPDDMNGEDKKDREFDPRAGVALLFQFRALRHKWVWRVHRYYVAADVALRRESLFVRFASSGRLPPDGPSKVFSTQSVTHRQADRRWIPDRSTMHVGVGGLHPPTY